MHLCQSGPAEKERPGGLEEPDQQKTGSGKCGIHRGAPATRGGASASEGVASTRRDNTDLPSRTCHMHFMLSAILNWSHDKPCGQDRPLLPSLVSSLNPHPHHSHQEEEMVIHDHSGGCVSDQLWVRPAFQPITFKGA